jgi:NADH:ubiquinone oxidoreductase subunit K
MSLSAYHVALLLAAALFSVGVYGLLTRRNAIAILLSIELMANAVNINLVTFSRFLGNARGQVFSLFTISLTVAEVVVGLAIVVLLYRTRSTIEADEIHSLQG